MNTVRIERRLSRAGRPRARVDLRVVAAVAAMFLLFVCSFAIGRAANSAGSARAEAPVNLTIAPVAASIPIRLATAPPVQLGAPPKPPPPVRHSSPPPALRLVAPVETPSAPAPTPAPEASQPAPVAPAQPAAPAPAPTPAPAPAPAPSPAPSSSGGGHSSGGGGSFESSG